MEFKTKFKIGDKVRRKITKNTYEFIKCPFCGGKGYVEYDGISIECENCDDGDYELSIENKVWSNTMTVVGAVMDKPFPLSPEQDDILKICVLGNIRRFHTVNMYEEDQLIFADEVEEGDPV